MEMDIYFKCCTNPMIAVLLICHMVCLLSSVQRSEDEVDPGKDSLQKDKRFKPGEGNETY